MRRAFVTLLVLGTLSCRSRPSAQASCIDSDVGTADPRYVSGVVIVADPAGKTTTIPDACESDHYVREGRCPKEPTDIDAQLGYYFLAVCENGCRDGACVR
jgi:hypothetical protein